MGNLKHRALRGRVIAIALKGLSFITRHLPLPVIRVFGVAIGDLAYYALPRYRHRALNNIAMAFPEWSERQRRTAIRRMFRDLGASTFELGWLDNLDRKVLERTTEIRGVENIDEARSMGRGTLIFTGHCGNWEWLAATTALLGYPLTVLQRDRDEKDFNRIIAQMHERVGMRTIWRGSTAGALEMFRTLRSGGFLGFLIDQNIRAESVKVPFFGQPALTPIGPAKLAVRAEAPVMLCFIERRNGKQIVTFHKPIPTSRNDDPVAITARLTAAIEEHIRQVPEQWVWFHPRWKERKKWEVKGAE
ncbi:MAG TPA: lysophospholipid acyltransferase family protein [Thermoanaerobaculia bacterium]|nr:lysophospholipid acyltransferase family protein [Thermoanaerobaculia bacterium]